MPSQLSNDPNLHGYAVIRTIDASRLQFQSLDTGFWHDKSGDAGNISAVRFDGVVYGKPDEIVIAEIRARFDGYMRKIILITGCICVAAVIGAYLWRLTH